MVDAPGLLRIALQPLGQSGAEPTVLDAVRAAVPPGDYQMDITLGAVTVTQMITVPSTGTASPEVILNAAVVTLRPRIGPNAAIEATTQMTVSNAAGFSLQMTGQMDAWLPAGDYTLTARLDAVTATVPVTVVAGQALEQDVFISAAAVVPKVFYTAGQPVNDADLQVEIVAARPHVDGSRTLISSRNGRDPVFHLGAGDYVAITRLGLATAETAFSIALVQRTELPVMLDAGVLAVTATGSDLILIAPPPDIGGNAPAGSEFTGDAVQETLNAGAYQVTARFGAQITTAMVVITPGGRAEVVLTAP